jgi:alkylation response protein AidB-like acyl-CoA dehydrogenase
MAKLIASETAVRCCEEALRIHGSYGFSMDYPVQRYLRDAPFLLFGGGTSEILRFIISRELTRK